MKTTTWVLLIFLIALAGTMACLILGRGSRGALIPAATKHSRTVFEDIGLQIDLPSGPAFKSSDQKELLVMLYPTGGGLSREPEYHIKVMVSRVSKEELDARARRASKSGADAFNRWVAASHPSLDVRRQGLFWFLRRDIPSATKGILSVRCEAFERDPPKDMLVEATRIVESIKPLR